MTLDSYGVRATIVGLPGHTKGAIGILVEDTDRFVGDTLFNILRLSRSLLYGNQVNVVKSCNKISEYKGATIHFGHGKSAANRVW